jgi:hypothetical protein
VHHPFSPFLEVRHASIALPSSVKGKDGRRDRILVNRRFWFGAFGDQSYRLTLRAEIARQIA